MFVRSWGCCTSEGVSGSERACVTSFRKVGVPSYGAQYIGLGGGQGDGSGLESGPQGEGSRLRGSIVLMRANGEMLEEDKAARGTGCKHHIPHSYVVSASAMQMRHVRKLLGRRPGYRKCVRDSSLHRCMFAMFAAKRITALSQEG